MRWDPIDILEAMELDPVQLDRTLERARLREKWLSRRDRTYRSQTLQDWYREVLAEGVQPSSQRNEMRAHLQRNEMRAHLRNIITANVARDEDKVRLAELYIVAAHILAEVKPPQYWRNVRRKDLYATLSRWGHALGTGPQRPPAARRWVQSRSHRWSKRPNTRTYGVIAPAEGVSLINASFLRFANRTLGNAAHVAFEAEPKEVQWDEKLGT